MLKKLLLIFWSVSVFNAAYALTPPEQTEMVAAHNKWRQEAGVPEVKWSASVAAPAQRWADHLQQEKHCSMSHSATKDLGENLFWASPMRFSSGATKLQAVSPTRVADSWASEKAHYDYASNTCAGGKACGHYTQMVWRGTTEIGCAKAACGDNAQVWVCNYAPPGNWRGQKPW